MPTITAAPDLPKAPAVQPVQTSPIKQPSTNEAAAKPAETEASKSISPQYVALARKEKALRNQAQALKVEREAMLAEKARYESQYVPKEKLSERFKTDPVGLMREYGLSYDDLTQIILNQPSQESQAVKGLQAELESIKKSQLDSQKKQEEQQAENYKQAVQQIRNEVKSLVERDPSFETIKDTDSVDAVVELIEETFKKGWPQKNFQKGSLLTVEEAAKHIEDFLVEESFKLASLSKVKARLQPPQEVEKPIIQKQEIKTLTNAQVSPSQPLSNKDRRQRAILAFQGKL